MAPKYSRATRQGTGGGARKKKGGFMGAECRNAGNGKSRKFHPISKMDWWAGASLEYEYPALRELFNVR